LEDLMKKRHLAVKTLLMIAAVALLAGCETLRALLTVQTPDVRVTGVEITALSFDGVEVTAELDVSNPNPIGVTLTGFSYEFFVEGNRFVGGDFAEGIQIDPDASSTLRVPVAIEFGELLRTVQSLKDKSEAAYVIAIDPRFELPVIGEVSVPVAAEGTFPVVRLPDVQLTTVRLESLTLSGADLALELEVSNPNTFGVELGSLQYAFAVNGNPWVDGSSSGAQTIGAQRDSRVVIPFSVRFLSVGRAVYRLLTGDDTLDYTLELVAQVGTELALVPEVTLPFSLEGSVPLRR
jgi:LEA14-like dessication related protein